MDRIRPVSVTAVEEGKIGAQNETRETDILGPLVATQTGLVRMKDKNQENGRGGNAIVAGENAVVDLDNQGLVQAGKGGTGGSGGDAIHVAAGVKLTIVNKGIIAGGDAGTEDAVVVSELELEAMELAVQVAAQSSSEDQGVHPKVGAVLVKDKEILASAFRGELALGDHAEYTLFEKKLSPQIDTRGATLFTTLEPCTHRKRHRPCSEWIVEKGIRKVFIGILDPNPWIYAQGLQRLRAAGIEVDFFPIELRERVRKDNLRFIEKFFANPELRGEASFNYSANNGYFTIGHGEFLFETRWSKASDTSIHAYKDASSMRAIRLALGAESFDDLKDGSIYDASSRSQTVSEGEFLVWENSNGFFAAVQVLDVKDRTRPPDRVDSVTIAYRINQNGSARFSD